MRITDPTIRAGGVTSLDTVDATDTFDAITWAEQRALRWCAGSNYWVRTQPAVSEDEAGGLVQIARADRVTGDAVHVTLCRNGRLLAEYDDAPAATWNTSNAEVVFGRRHHPVDTLETGGLEGDVFEARIYGAALSCAAIGALTPLGAPLAP